MNRRDFLLLKTKGRERIAALSCERLFMRYVDAKSTHTRSGDQPASQGERAGWRPGGEPPTVIEEPNERELFEELRRDVSDADVVRVSDADWLLGDEFRRDVEELLEYARDRGIRVEYV